LFPEEERKGKCLRVFGRKLFYSPLLEEEKGGLYIFREKKRGG